MQKQKRSRLVTFALLTTVTVLTWVSVETYLIVKKTTIEEIPPEIIENIDPTLDTDILNTVEKRRFFNENTIPAVINSQASQSEEQKAQSTATSSGQLQK